MHSGARSSRGWVWLNASFISSLATFAALPDVASAQTCEMKVIEKSLFDQAALMVENLNCATAKIEALEAELGIYKSASGLVAAFNRASGDPCPDGWIPFGAANGRFVLGAGLSKQFDQNGAKLSPHLSYLEKPDEAVGGEESHEIQIGEMPPHRHFVANTPVLANGSRNQLRDDETLSTWAGVAQHGLLNANFEYMFRGVAAEPDVGKTSVAGGEPGRTKATAIGNMPPFVALYYCIKE